MVDEKIAKLAEALDWEAEGITPETALDELQWDSMAMLTVVALARTAGKKLSGAQVREMTTVGDILAAI